MNKKEKSAARKRAFLISQTEEEKIETTRLNTAAKSSARAKQTPAERKEASDLDKERLANCRASLV